MIKNIIIIGTGWYGCYAAFLLQDLYNVTLIEKNSNIFDNSSYYNQNRLHLGYHYIRNHKTRVLCKLGFYKFIEKFNDTKIIDRIHKNLYLISDKSFIDYETIYAIYKYNNYNFDIIENNKFKNIHKNMLNVDECVINSTKAKDFFSNNLKCKILYNKKVISINNQIITFNDNTCMTTDLIIDCTYNSLNLSTKEYIYEKTISLLYKKIKIISFDAITIVDGDFFSLYPHDLNNNIYTLTDVEFTPLIKSVNINDIHNFILDESKLNDTKLNMVNKVKYYYHNFEEEFVYIGYFLSNKTKLISNSDSRECNIEKINDYLITINCGKITGIFDMEQYLKEVLLIE